MQMLAEYRNALRSYAVRHQHLYMDPNPGIDDVLHREYPRTYLNDHIHPNAGAGIQAVQLEGAGGVPVMRVSASFGSTALAYFFWCPAT